jgi:ArpU family phage transcriptional regulator
LQIMLDILPPIDRKKTQKAVDDAFERYRIYKQIGYEEKEAKITPAYAERESGPTNQTSDSTADIAVANVDIPAQMRRYCERIEKAVAKLRYKPRKLITERFMTDDDVFDYQVMNEKFDPPISEATYYKIKWEAVYSLAFSLEIYVLDEESSKHQKE